jgi:hypothetical protein
MVLTKSQSFYGLTIEESGEKSIEYIYPELYRKLIKECR